MALLQPDLGILGSQTCHLACLVASLWRPGVPWVDLGTAGSTTKDTLRSMVGFHEFSVDLGKPFRHLFIYLGPKKAPIGVLWHAWRLHFGVLADLATILGYRGAQEQTLLGTGLNFQWFLVDSEAHFEGFLGTLSAKCILLCLFAGSFSDDFWVWIWMSGSGKPSIWHEKQCKNQLSRKLDFS